jgi:hypothetical protein
MVLLARIRCRGVVERRTLVGTHPRRGDWAGTQAAAAGAGVAKMPRRGDGEWEWELQSETSTRHAL